MRIQSTNTRLTVGGDIGFRPVEPGDGPLLLEAYASTRADELARTNWDQALRDAFIRMQFNAQQADYQTNYPGSQHLVVLLNGKGVGRIWFNETEEEIHILDLTILPSSRNAGLGTCIMRELMAQSSGSGKPLTIYVESYNRSLGLFERLGFKKAGEAGYSYLMKFLQ